MGKNLNILLIEDNEDDVILLLRHLKKNDYIVNYKVAESEIEVRNLLDEGGWDLIISDYSMPQFSGMEALEIFKEYNIDIPFILLSGTIGEDVAVEAMKMGAHDYLMKDKLHRLTPAIERELNEAKVRREREEALNKLKQSEENYRSVVENALDIIITMDLVGNLLSINNTGANSLGWDEKEAIGQPFSKFVHADDIDLTRGKFKNTISGIQNPEYEIRIKKKSGDYIVGAIKTTLLKEGANQRVLGFIRDVTNRKKMEERITILSKASNQSPVSIIITDIEENISYVNDKFLSVSGLSREEINKKSTKDIISSELTDDEYIKIWMDVANYEIWRGEVYSKNSRGIIIWEDVTVSPIKDKKGKIIRYLIIKIDITKRKEVFAELMVAKKEAEAANRVKSEFLAQMSHEIRTPLNTMLSFHQLIKSDLDDKLDADLLSCLQGAEKASERIIRTIDLILNMTEVQVGSFNPAMENIDIFDIVLEDLILEKSVECKSKGLKLSLIKSTDYTELIADRYSVSQIFENLLSNAIKYTHEGEITIDCFRDNNGYLAVSIADTGIGISEENKEKIFNPFVQAENGYTRSYEGNGLGLALVKEYCKLNRAVIKVESEIGKGSKFTVTFMS